VSCHAPISLADRSHPGGVLNDGPFPASVSVTQLSRATNAALLLAATLAMACVAHNPPKLVAYGSPAPSSNDALIEPGVRIGPVSLGMTEAALKAAVGEPYNSETTQSGAELENYPDLGLRVFVYDGHVYKIGTQTLYYDGQSYSSPRYLESSPGMHSREHTPTPRPNGYRTRDDIGLGTPKETVLAKMGEPAWTRLLNRNVEVNCYAGDTEVEVWRGAGPNRNRVIYLALGACDDTTP
jgi:hypothetical protein